MFFRSLFEDEDPVSKPREVYQHGVREIWEDWDLVGITKYDFSDFKLHIHINHLQYDIAKIKIRDLLIKGIEDGVLSAFKCLISIETLKEAIEKHRETATGDYLVGINSAFENYSNMPFTLYLQQGADPKKIAEFITNLQDEIAAIPDLDAVTFHPIDVMLTQNVSIRMQSLDNESIDRHSATPEQIDKLTTALKDSDLYKEIMNCIMERPRLGS